MPAAIHPGAGAAVEFFAGMGLVRRALESGPPAGQWKTVFANDIDPTKARVYRAMFPGSDGILHECDIATLCASDIPPAELWTASFPCTDLSLAGKGAGIHAGQSGAVWAMLDLLAETEHDRRPRSVFFENVPALLTSHAGADLHALVSALNTLGYAIDPMLVNASHFTPQSRSRVFLIASQLADPSSPPVSDPNLSEPCAVRPERVVGMMRENPDLLWHTRPLPPLPRRATTLNDIFEQLTPSDPRWWPDDRHHYFLNQIHPAHQPLAQRLQHCDTLHRRTAFRRVRTINGVKRSLIELRDDGLAGCLRTPKGGSAKQIVFEAGKGVSRVRFLTATEAARLQGVSEPLPDGFTETELLFALGDAVCVPAVRWALDQIRQGAPATIAADAEHPSRSAPAPIIATASS